MDLINETPMRPGWGKVWQGSEFGDVDDIPEPHVIVSMVGALLHVKLNLSTFMWDNDTAVLEPAVLLGMTSACLGFLSQGINLYVHCWEGKYRSTYMDVAIHMAGLHYSVDQAYGYVKRSHPIADLRTGTTLQLRSLEERLRGMEC